MSAPRQTAKLDPVCLVETVEIGGSRFEIERPADDEPLVREGVERGDLDPAYWAHLWPSAHAMAGWVLGSSMIGPGVRVLEIGCGLGLVGIGAARRGALVLMTDFDAQSVAIASRNVQRNGVEAGVERFDWRDEPRPGWAFDVVIGSDVLYRPEAHAEIAGLIGRLSERSPCVAILADPNRRQADAAISVFEDAGLRVWATPGVQGRVLMVQA